MTWYPAAAGHPRPSARRCRDSSATGGSRHRGPGSFQNRRLGPVAVVDVPVHDQHPFAAPDEAAAATATLLIRQKPMARSASAWCPGGRATTKAEAAPLDGARRWPRGRPRPPGGRRPTTRRLRRCRRRATRPGAHRPYEAVEVGSEWTRAVRSPVGRGSAPPPAGHRGGGRPPPRSAATRCGPVASGWPRARSVDRPFPLGGGGREDDHAVRYAAGPRRPTRVCPTRRPGAFLPGARHRTGSTPE